MSDQWYFVRDGKPSGPITLTQLKAELHARPKWKEELVWREGMDDWLEAGNISELAITPPPLPKKAAPAPPPPPPIATPSEPPKQNGISRAAISIFGFIGMLLVASFAGVIGKEGVRAIFQGVPLSKEETERGIQEGLAKGLQQMRATLPNKVDESTTMVDAKLEGKLVSYFYVFDDVNYTLAIAKLRPEVAKNVCANEAMIKAMKLGIRYRYTYDDTKRKRLTSFELGQSDCNRT